MPTQPYAKRAADEARQAPGPGARSAPPAAPVNTGPRSASNRAQERAKEAEEDRALIALAQAGEVGAFRQLVERHQRRAFSVALALVRDESDAREIVQEAFLRAFRNLPTFQGGSSFFTWLYRIVTNLSIDLMRKPGRQSADFEESRMASEDAAEADYPMLGRLEGSDPAAVVRRTEIAGRLQAALDALPTYHRAVVVMREVEGLSYEDMARAMGVSKGTIMSRLFHARQKLQRALADCYAEQVSGARLDDEEGQKP